MQCDSSCYCTLSCGLNCLIIWICIICESNLFHGAHCALGWTCTCTCTSRFSIKIWFMLMSITFCETTSLDVFWVKWKMRLSSLAAIVIVIVIVVMCGILVMLRLRLMLIMIVFVSIISYIWNLKRSFCPQDNVRINPFISTAVERQSKSFAFEVSNVILCRDKSATSSRLWFKPCPIPLLEQWLACFAIRSHLHLQLDPDPWMNRHWHLVLV